MALIALLLPVLAVLALVVTARLESWMQPTARASARTAQPARTPQPALTVESAEAVAG